jgi:hypothetical protein
MYHGRSFFRMLDILLKIRSSAAAHPGSLAAAPAELVRALSGAGDAGGMTTRRPALLEPSDRFAPVSLGDIPAPEGPIPLETPPPLGSLAAGPVVEQNLRNEPSRNAQASDERNPRNEPSRGVGQWDERREPPGSAGAACPGVVSGGGASSEAGGGFPGRPPGLAAPTPPDLPFARGGKETDAPRGSSSANPSPAVAARVAQRSDPPIATARRMPPEHALALQAAVLHAAALRATPG